MKSPLLLVFFCVNLVRGPKIGELRASITQQEQRAFIKCSVLLGYPASKVYFDLQKIARRQAFSQKHVYNLYNEFSNSTRLSSDIESHEGRPRTVTDTTHKEKLIELFQEDKN